jgi:hypothetical protein
MLATLTETLPSQGKWIYEPKLDGVRALIYVSGGTVRIYSRNRKPLNGAYPELVEALEPAVRGDAVLDGEIVGSPVLPACSNGCSCETRSGRDGARCPFFSICSTVCSMKAWISPRSPW